MFIATHRITWVMLAHAISIILLCIFLLAAVSDTGRHILLRRVNRRLLEDLVWYRKASCAVTRANAEGTNCNARHF